jgi:transmembrane sensor
VGSRRLGAGEEGWFPPLLVAPPSGAAHTTAVKKERRRVRPAAVRSTGAGAPGAVARAIARNEAQPWQDEVARPVAVAVADTPPEPRTSEDIPVTPASGASGTSGTRTAVEAPPAVDHQEASASTLLADADRARLAGRFEEGASLLRRLVRDYPADQRAPLAAFSLGRLLLGELGRPAEAARAFARARSLAPEGPLAEDALAREAEAWERAKHLDRARARAAEYLRVYPSGRRAADVNEVMARAAASASP